MPDISITVSEPVSAIIKAASEIVVAALNLSAKYRDSMSDAAKDADDRIRSQMYWDWRGVLQWAKIVGEPLPWPQPK